MTLDPPRSSGVSALEAMLQSCCETVQRSLDLAHGIDRAKDDHGQDVAYKRALAFMKASAKVGLALGKVQSQHSTNIRVHRSEDRAGAGPTKLSEARSKLALEAARRAGDEEFWERWSRTFHAEENRAAAEAAEAAEAAKAAEEGVPPSNSGGSNTPSS